MKWDLSESDYPQIDIAQDHVLGLSMWLEIILDMTTTEHSVRPWNVLVADIWPNDPFTRLIGHVQMNDVSIGYDTGFRVCAYLTGGGIEGYLGDDTPRIKQWLSEAVASASLKSRLQTTAKDNTFDIRLSFEGGGDLRSISQIKF